MALEAIRDQRTLAELSREYEVSVSTDQGSQYTCKFWSDTLASYGTRGRMDGRGWCKDNFWIERFWRSFKRECVYLNPVDTVCQMRNEIARYIEYYNAERLHQGIDNRMPIEMCPEEFINKLKDNWQSAS